ncbi:Acyl-CoA N-acyltransferase [Phytophthora cactorum]|nr:Acyl-CoA N-acyltransferase [Phytophthora cactorum]
MAKSKSSSAADADAVVFSTYQGEKQLAELVKLIDKDLSEPYSIFTYRYFLYNWPQLSILARVQHKLVGVIICRDPKRRWRGYIAMLAVEKQFRHRGIGSQLAQKAIERMRDDGCEEVMLETEIANKGAIRLYENLGFVRDERLVKYYLNGGDAYRLKLWLQ